MIDKFQDNNSLQWDFLFLISEKAENKSTQIPTKNDLYPNKLFFVGDDKQSIYLFRGADVSVFNKLKSDMNCENTRNKQHACTRR